MSIYRKALTVHRVAPGEWQAFFHGDKETFQALGATAEEALSNAGKLIDFTAQAWEKFQAENDPISK